MSDHDRREYDAPSSILKEERRKQGNIAANNNHSDECMRRVAAAGECTCEQQEDEVQP